MKQTSKMVMVAVALLAGVSGTAWANGTEVPPEPTPYTPPPAPMKAPVPPPLVKAERTGTYISAAIGVGIPGSLDTEDEGDLDLDNNLVLNGAIGYNFGSVRLEGAVGYQNHDLSNIDDEDIALLTIMANAYYDFDAGSGIKPYIMGGAGIANVDTSWDDQDEIVFAWQIGAGLGFEVAYNTTVDVGYRYLKPSDFENDSVGTIKCESHNMMLGLRYQF
jgi:opacity protein-like surface antigen